jgi:protease I
VNPDNLRADQKAVALTRAFVDSGKPVAATCHGPWVLIEGIAEGRHERTMTGVTGGEKDR